MFPSTSRKVLAPSQFEEVCFPHHWLKSSINLDNDLTLRHRANLIWMEPYRVICIFHFKSRRRSFKNLNPWPFQNFPREKVPYSFLYQDPWYTIIVYVNKSYSASSIKAQNLLPQFYMCGVATHSTKCAEVLLHAHVKESWLRNPRNFDLWNPKSEKKKSVAYGFRNHGLWNPEYSSKNPKSHWRTND